MSQLTITAIIIAKPECREIVKQSLLQLIPPTLLEEGCLNYDLHQDLIDVNRFFFYENWSGRDLWLKHNASKHIKAHLEATKDSILKVIISEMEPLALNK